MIRSKEESTAGTRAVFFEALKAGVLWGALALLVSLPLLLACGSMLSQSS